MAGNRFGKNFTLTTFGESHGNSIGGVIDGCPAGLEINLDQVQKELDRRRPGQSEYTTQRKESDVVEFYSGIYEGKSTGTPIGFRLMNSDTKSGDYDHLKDNFRPSHADYTYHSKYGHRDHKGGGRSSARETACRVVAGAIARQLLSGVEIRAYVESVEKIQIPHDYQALDLSLTDQSPIRCPHPATAEKIQELIARARDEGDSLGGVICCVVKGVPAGWGEPVFDKLHADLAKAMLSINAVKGFEYGSGFAGTRMRGSEHNDAYGADGELLSNFSGGIQGGISNGADIYFRTAFKPTATLLRDQSGLSKSGEAVNIEGKGRHDPCVLPRAVPIVEAMAALVLVDQMLSAKLNQHN